MITHVLFDFDGTLMDTNDLIVEALRASALKFRGKDIEEDELQKILGKPLMVQMTELDPEHAEEMDAYYRTYYRARRDAYTKEFDGIREMLDTLLEMGLKMGIVSNKGTSGIEHGLTSFDLHKYFNSTVSADDVIKRKPDPEGIFKALKVLDGKPENTLFIGDSAHDIESGKNAGAKTVLVGWTILDRKRLMESCPDHLVETPAEIVDIVKSLM
ncbi:HAD family hydrolase [Fusibacter sp. JL216-2]|uniref:HAD family hydrolase n=1 Tax=Fusibacter sp. JL216-2 TaxID=3071453 RepID=UPI003D337AEE